MHPFQLEGVGKQLTYNQPYIYHAAVPGWAEQYPSLVRAAAGKHVTQPPFYNTEHLATLGGMSVTGDSDSLTSPLLWLSGQRSLIDFEVRKPC